MDILNVLKTKEYQAQRRQVGNQQYSKQQNKEKWQGCYIQFHHWFIEAVAGNEQIEPDWGRQVAELHR